MKITVLMENAPRPGFKAEHGLSLLLEAAGKTILFDFGQSDGFARNADVLGIDLTRVDFGVLSHGHYDHGNGIREFLRRNDHAPVYLSRHCFRDHRHGERYIGLDRRLWEEPRLRPIGEDTVLSPGLTLRCCEDLERIVPPEQDGLMAQGQPDDFRHELCLEIQEEGRKILVSGCSHNGAENLLRRFRPQVFIGGLHSRSMDISGPAFGRLTRSLALSGAKICTGHCTGKDQFKALQATLGDRAAYLYTGWQFPL